MNKEHMRQIKNLTKTERAFLGLYAASKKSGGPVLMRDIVGILQEIGIEESLTQASAILCILRKRGFVSSSPAPKRLGDGRSTQHVWKLTPKGRKETLTSPAIEHINALCEM